MSLKGRLKPVKSSPMHADQRLLCIFIHATYQDGKMQNTSANRILNKRILHEQQFK